MKCPKTIEQIQWQHNGTPLTSFSSWVKSCMGSCGGSTNLMGSSTLGASVGGATGASVGFSSIGITTRKTHVMGSDQHDANWIEEIFKRDPYGIHSRFRLDLDETK